VSPNVVELISNFNRFSAWVASEIVSYPSLKKRVQALKNFITIGYTTYSYRDYETTFIVVLALSLHSVSFVESTIMLTLSDLKVERNLEKLGRTNKEAMDHSF
jgi:hypothetical protein